MSPFIDVETEVPVVPAKVQYQKELLEKLKKIYPQHVCRFDVKSMKFKIEWFETNKIRILLARYYNVGGYPVKFNHHVAYYSGIAMWIPDQWAIEPKTTRDTWLKTPEWQYRRVCIWKVDPYDTIQASYIAGGAGVIPVVGGAISGAINQIKIAVAMGTMKWIDIYPIILFYNTINDIIIWANWEFVRTDLNKIERVKYLAPVEDVVLPVYPVG